MYGHCGHLGHVNWTIWKCFRSPIPSRFHMKFGLVVIVEKHVKNIESERFGPRPVNDFDL